MSNNDDLYNEDFDLDTDITDQDDGDDQEDGQGNESYSDDEVARLKAENEAKDIKIAKLLSNKKKAIISRSQEKQTSGLSHEEIEELRSMRLEREEQSIKSIYVDADVTKVKEYISKGLTKDEAIKLLYGDEMREQQKQTKPSSFPGSYYTGGAEKKENPQMKYLPKDVQEYIKSKNS